MKTLLAYASGYHKGGPRVTPNLQPATPNPKEGRCATKESGDESPHSKMIEKIIEASIRNRFPVFVLGAALTVAGVYAMLHTPVDAIPDLSENQVIVFTDWMGRSPREIEDQVTYPLSLKLEGLAGIRAVRSSSEFNFSMITLIFEDDIDYYFARQRVTE
ncbi:MAG: efflux RND transporter permease subunit, partial [Pirellulales bacterium]